jgi:NADPH:quinone reductase-like Zn-dependent oxidoreductase
MKAFLLNGYGGPEKAGLGDCPEPEIKPDDILVKVMAAGLNPIDYKIRQGAMKLIQRLNLPVPMGSEAAGTVEKTGPLVTKFKPGDRVFFRCDKGRMGAFAETVATSETSAALMPKTVDFVAAASIPLAALTALQVLRDQLQVKRGDRIFISGGAGGVGTFAIQLSKWMGAHVVTTASPRGAELVSRLGADRVIDYTSQDFSNKIRDMDGAFDLLGGETLLKSFSCVKAGGKVVSIAGVPEPETARQDLALGAAMASLFWLISLKTRLAARRKSLLARLIDDGTVKPVIDKVFPFSEAAGAFNYLETGRAKGKIVLSMM